MNKNVEIIKLVDLSYGKVELRSDNILAFRPDLGVFKEYNIQILEELLPIFKNVTDDVPRPYLCDNRYITGIVNKEEQAFMNKHFGDFATKAALLTKSPVVSVLLNGYNSIFKPKVEIKLFTTEEKAVKWLLG